MTSMPHHQGDGTRHVRSDHGERPWALRGRYLRMFPCELILVQNLTQKLGLVVWECKAIQLGFFNFWLWLIEKKVNGDYYVKIHKKCTANVNPADNM